MHTQPPKKASSKDWHPADVIAALHKAGLTMAKLANQHGLKGSTSLSVALTRSLPSGEKRIADALGLHPKEIWPSRYYDNGERKPQGFRAIQFNRASAGCNGKKQATA